MCLKKYTKTTPQKTTPEIGKNERFCVKEDLYGAKHPEAFRFLR